jgi:adenylate cyclase
MEFSSVVDAVQFAVEVQVAIAERNVDIPEDRRIVYRIGINIGDIIVEGDDIYGDGVNVAARLEGLCEPGGVCIARNVFNQVKGKLDLTFEHLGEKEVKNIAEPVSVYRIDLDDKAAALVTPIAVTPSTTGRGRWPQIAAGLVFSLVVVIGLVWLQPWAPDVEPASVEAMAFPLPDKPSIAVLPFTNMSDDPEQEYFADGMTDDLITDLSKISGLFVIARNSSFAYKGQPVNIREIAHQLGVAYVVEGSVRKAGNRVRITAQLIEVEQGNHVWAERYDRDLEDIFTVQDEVSQSIVSTLVGRLEGIDIDRAKRKRTENMTAYDFLLRGKEHFERSTKTESALARPLFQKAIELDPEYAQRHVWLAWTHFYDFELGWSDDPDESYALGLACAQHAVEVDNTDARAHAAVAYSYAYGSQHDLCQTHIERACKLNPNDADILALKGLFLAYLGNPAEGVKSAEAARRLNPLAPEWYLWCFGIALYTASRYEDAVAAWRQMANPPTEIFACLAAGYAQLDQLDEAQACLVEFHKRASKELPNYPGDDRAGWQTYWFNSFPYKHAADQRRLLDGLRKAGLPV